MKPQTQIDFIVEEFFNTGRIDFDKEDTDVEELKLFLESYMEDVNDPVMVAARAAAEKKKKIIDAGFKNMEVARQEYDTAIQQDTMTDDLISRLTAAGVYDELEQARVGDEVVDDIGDEVTIDGDEATIDGDEATIDEEEATTIIKDRLDRIYTLYPALYEEGESVAKELGIDLDNPEDRMAKLFWGIFEERESKIEARLAITQEIETYAMEELTDQSARILRGRTWNNATMVDLGDQIGVLKQQLGAAEVEGENFDRDFPHIDGDTTRTDLRKEKLGEIRATITNTKEEIETLKKELTTLTKENDPNILFVDVIVDNFCFLNLLLEKRTTEEQKNNFNALRATILKKYDQDTPVDEKFKFFETLNRGLINKGVGYKSRQAMINQIKENFNGINPSERTTLSFPDVGVCTIEEFNRLVDPTRFVSRAKESVMNVLPTKLKDNQSDLINKRIEQAFARVNSIFNIITNDDNDILKQKSAIKDRYVKLMEIIESYGLGVPLEEWKKKYAKADEYERRYMLRLVEGSLSEVVYGLGQMESQMRDIIQNEGLLDKETLKILQNVYTQVNDAPTITDNLEALQINNSRLYEESFAQCRDDDNRPYFTHSTQLDESGDGSTIVLGSEQTNSRGNILGKKNNKWLLGKIVEIRAGSTSAEAVANIIYGEINAEGVKKFDIKSTQPVTLTALDNSSTLIIPADQYIEVKKGKAGGFLLSEFFGAYKNYTKLPDEYNTQSFKSIYNNIIDQMVEKVSGRDESGEYTDTGIINMIKDNTYGIFFEHYVFYKIDDLKLEWRNSGRNKTESRLSVWVSPKETATPYKWNQEDGNCNCKPFLPDVECGDNQPATEAIDNYISEALGF